MPNMELPPVACTPDNFPVLAGGGWIDGYGSLLGNVNEELSSYESISCEFDPSTLSVTGFGQGQMVGANGDMYFIDIVESLDLTTMNFTGDVYLTGGTGKFEDAEGHFDMVNGVVYADGSMSWEGYGEYILKK